MPSPELKPVLDVDAIPNRAGDMPAWALPLQVLRRTGLRPLSVHGATIATVCGVTSALPYWYELNVHRTAPGAYLSDVRLFRKDSDQADLFRVEEHADLDALVAYLEDYDPSGDLAPAADMLDGATSNAALALRTARLQIEINRITEHYRATVCQLLGTVMTLAD